MKNRYIHVLTAITIFYIVLNILHAEEKKLPVFILAGQSNMVGGGKREELPEELKKPQKDALFVKFWGVKWKPLEPGKRFGPEVTFGAEMARALKQPVGIIKLANGGTSLEKHWNPKEYDKEKGIGGLYKRLIGYVKRMRNVNPDIKIVGMLWMQGEADSRYYSKTMEQYRDKLKALVEGCRKEFDNKEMFFVCGRVNPPNWPFEKNVRKAQETVKLDNYAWIDCDKLEKHKDNLHYNTKGQIELGKKFAQAMVKLMKDAEEKKNKKQRRKKKKTE